MNWFLLITFPILIIVTVVVLYITAALVGFVWKTTKYKNRDATIQIYILTNGAHTDFILPLQHELFDWNAFLDNKNVVPVYNWIGIGWGDKGFYLDIPEWKDLKLKTAVNALFWNSKTLMHVTFHEKMQENEKCVGFKITETEYQELLNYITSYFYLEEDKPIMLLGAGYTAKDFFYHAHSKYSLFKTCNVWTNQGIRKMGYPTGMWSPFERTVMASVRTIAQHQTKC